MRSHEAVAQGAGYTGQLTFLWQQQGNLGQWLAGHFLELDQCQRQLQGSRVLRVLAAPGLDGGLLLFQGAGAFYCQGQAGPAGEGAIAGAGALQLIAGQGCNQVPDGILVVAGGVAAEQRRQVDTGLRGGQALAIGFQHLGLNAASAALLFVR
ncbi:hypothetical protein D3C77_415690 [compost metagenome]